MRLLVVEDEEQLALQVKETLENEEYTVDVAFDGDSGLEQALSEDYDLLILDILLPGIDGISLLETVRKEGYVMPVLMLTAQGRIEDKVRGLDAGADDYLTKPFAPPELLARIRSLLRRRSEVKSTSITLGELEIDTGTRQVKRAGELIALTKKEYAIFEFLLYNKNRVISRLSIAEHVWGDNFDLFRMTNFVDVHVKNLRKKISPANPGSIVKTVRGVGYLIEE